MGRKTYDSLPVVLKNRNVIIISRNLAQLHLPPENHFVCDSLDHAISLAESIEDTEAFIVGGKSLYDESLQRNMLDKVYLTLFRSKVDLPVTNVVTLPSYERFLSDTDIDSKTAFKSVVNIVPTNTTCEMLVEFLTFNL